ncbi:MAG TPA: nuclease-related domain-containing protein [Syntrophales bacterium]|nr:nuclease-related domain-containing protein [Syntrophales bacterium]
MGIMKKIQLNINTWQSWPSSICNTTASDMFRFRPISRHELMPEEETGKINEDMKVVPYIKTIQGEYLMKKIILSDHITEVLDERHKQREGRNVIRLEDYRNELKKRQDMIDESRRFLKESLREGRFIEAIRNTMEYYKRKKSEKPLYPTLEGPDVKERRYASGRDGEWKVDKYFGHRLNDEWAILAGYRNVRGEIDRLLVGLGGIFAMEIKNIKGNVSCSGNDWKRSFYIDGIPKEEPIIDGKDDGKRRGPGRQLNEPADVLEKYLNKTFPSCRICRIIVFTHEKTKLGSLEGHAMDEVVLLGNWQLEETLEKSSFRMTGPELEKMVRKIENSHQFHDRIIRSHGGSKEAA